MTARRTAIMLIFLGAGMVILAGTRTWASVVVHDLPGLSELTVSGGRAAPAGIPIALAAAASAFVLATSGLAIRMLAAAGLMLLGLVAAVASVRFSRDPTVALAKAMEDSLGLISRSADGGRAVGHSAFASSQVDLTFWPWVATAGGALIASTGLLVLVTGRSWPVSGRRFERETSPPQGDSSPANPAGTWDALSRGEDPTSDPPAVRAMDVDVDDL